MHLNQISIESCSTENPVFVAQKIVIFLHGPKHALLSMSKNFCEELTKKLEFVQNRIARFTILMHLT